MAKITPLRSHPNKTDREQVRVLAASGATPDFIASELNIDLDELTTHYQKDIELGPIEANAKVAHRFFQMAESGEFPNLTLSWMKMRAGWSETTPSSTSNKEEEEAELTSTRERIRALLQNRPDVADKIVNN